MNSGCTRYVSLLWKENVDIDVTTTAGLKQFFELYKKGKSSFR